jgi:hypothetical protein
VLARHVPDVDEVLGCMLLGVEVAAWRAVSLPRVSEVEELLGGGTIRELERLGQDAKAALAAWTRSLTALLPKD